jgi:hypothetical protein
VQIKAEQHSSERPTKKSCGDLSTGARAAPTQVEVGWSNSTDTYPVTSAQGLNSGTETRANTDNWRHDFLASRNSPLIGELGASARLESAAERTKLNLGADPDNERTMKSPGTRKICSALGALLDQKGGTKLETRIAKDNQMATKIKTELELQAIKSLGTTTIQTQRFPEKSNEEK